VEYLGKQVACQHCRGQFEAADPANARAKMSDSSLMLARAEELLAGTELKPAAGT
jgi:hypothetical protein